MHDVGGGHRTQRIVGLKQAARHFGFLPILLLMAASPQATAPSGAPAVSQRPLSAVHEFEGVYVTNFEIGYFVACDPATGGCDNWSKQELRWLVGEDWAREKMLMACVARWNGSRDRWALYAIRFQGQETLDRQPKQVLNDTERPVFFDRIEALELIGTDDTWEYELPRYRRKPRMGC
jgi:hypothetical protein